MRREPQRWPARYELLDGLRGVACLLVLLHHLGIVEAGHYAVMIFFVISGYCITASAQSCVRQGIPFSGFMLRRVRRIYPPYLLALLFFAITRIAKQFLTSGYVWNPSALDVLQNVTLTQWLSLSFHPMAWAADNHTLFVAAFWSLNYEEQFYLTTGLGLLLAYRFGFDLLRTVLVLACVGLIWNVFVPGGWITGFFVEYWAHFALGSAVYFVLCENASVRTRRWFFGVVSCLAIYCVTQLLPWKADYSLLKRAYVELAALSTFAIALVLLRPISATVSQSVLWKPIAALGTISYSLYLVHQFNLSLVEGIVGRMLPSATGALIATVAKVFLHIGIGTAFWYACERPFLRAIKPRKERIDEDSIGKRSLGAASAHDQA